MPRYIELRKKNLIAKFIENLSQYPDQVGSVKCTTQTINNPMTISGGDFFWERGCFYFQMICFDISKKFIYIYKLSSSYAEPKQCNKTKLLKIYNNQRIIFIIPNFVLWCFLVLLVTHYIFYQSNAAQILPGKGLQWELRASYLMIKDYLKTGRRQKCQLPLLLIIMSGSSQDNLARKDKICRSEVQSYNSI